MGIQINGNTDTISATDGSLVVSGAELPAVININATGIITATSFVGNVTGDATGLSGTPNLNVGIVTAASFVGNGSALTGIAGTANVSTNTLVVAGVTTATGGIRVSSGSSIGIGTANPRAPQEIYITGAANGSTTDAIIIDNDNSNSNDNLATGIVWKRKGNSSTYNYSRIDSVRTGTHDTDIVFSTNYGTTLYEELRIKSNGGITFNGDTAAANALDDYEEGTFTATFAGSSDTTTGYYTKIGRLVHVHLYASGINVTSSVGAVVGGLPFTVRNQYSTGAANHNTYTTNGDNFYFTTNGTGMYFYNENSIGQSSTNVGTRYVMMSGSYTTDT